MDTPIKRPVGRPRKHPLPTATPQPRGDGLRRAAYQARMLAQDADPYRRAVQPPTLAPGIVPQGVTAPVLAMDALGYSYANQAFPGGGFPGFPYLAELATRAEYRAMASAMSTELTREWIEFTSQRDDMQSSDKIKDIEAEFKSLGVQRAIQRAAEHDCYFGRGQIFVEIANADRSRPLILDPRTVKPGSLRRVVTVEPLWTTPSGYNTLDPAAPDFYRPSAWYMLGQEVHASRLLTVITRPLPDMLKPAYNFSGMSLSQLAEPYVDNWLRTRQSVSDLINNFSITALATSMDQVLQGADDGADVFARAELFTATRSNKGLMLLDKDREELAQINTPLSGLHELQAQSQEQMCAVSRMPAIVLTGISPSGLNASSEGEIRTFYDWIAAQQEAYWREPLEIILKIVQLSLFGEIDPDIGITFVPLYQMTPAEEAEIRAKDGNTDCAYVASGILDPSEVRQRLADDPLSGYQGLDADLVIVPPMQPGPDEIDPEMQQEPAMDAEFDESKHPRDENGQFGSGGGGAEKSPEDKAAFAAAKADGIAIPPAWTSVTYYGKTGKDGVIATGTDSAGRKQRVEDPAYRAAKIAEKQARIAANLAPRMPEITDQLREAASGGNEAAKVLYLITQTGFRIGGEGDGKSKVKAFGATTIQGDHVKVDGDTVHFDFPGKKGVRQQHSVTDPVIASMFREVKPGEKVFQVSDDKVRQEWKKYKGEKVHDIRSYVATVTARDALSKMIPPKPKTEKELSKLKIAVATVAARKLGNNPAESLATYINPAVFEAAK